MSRGKQEQLTIYDVPVAAHDDAMPFKAYSRFLGANMFLHASITEEKGKPVLGLSHLPAFQPINRLRPLAVMAEKAPEGRNRAIRIVQPGGRKPIHFSDRAFQPLHALLSPFGVTTNPAIFLARSNGDIGRVVVDQPAKPLTICSEGITERLVFPDVPAHTVALAAVRAVVQLAAERSWA